MSATGLSHGTITLHGLPAAAAGTPTNIEATDIASSENVSDADSAISVSEIGDDTLRHLPWQSDLLEDLSCLAPAAGDAPAMFLSASHACSAGVGIGVGDLVLSALSACAVAKHETSSTAVEDVKPRKFVDPVKAARKRLRLQQRKEARAARKAKKRDRALAKVKEAKAKDLEDFRARTRERLELQMAESILAAQASAAAESDEAKRGSGADVQGFLASTQKRVAEEAAAAKARAEAQEALRVAKEETAAASTELEDFRKLTQDRVIKSLWSNLPQVMRGVVSSGALDVNEFFRRRIAIVGAGPVGLWAALLLAEKFRGPAELCNSLARRPDAPEVTIFEARPEHEHCARTDIRIALSTSTCNLLNSRTHSKIFASGMSVSTIEETLLKRWRRIAPPDATLAFGRPIDNPAMLANTEGVDCVLWAGGRRSLDSGLRSSFGCGVCLGEAERVLVFQFGGLEPGSDMHSDLSTAVQQASKRPELRVILRPGASGLCAGWLWLFGLPSGAIAASNASKQGPPWCSFTEALAAVLDGPASPCATVLHQVAEALQEKLRPTECSARWVEAAYWSSERSVCEMKPPHAAELGAAAKPLVLMGDSLCGKPFYTGTTLNSHLKDAAALIDEVDWTHDGMPFACGRFDAHERRYQMELCRVGQFERRLPGAGVALERSRMRASSQKRLVSPQLQLLPKIWPDGAPARPPRQLSLPQLGARKEKLPEAAVAMALQIKKQT